MTKEIAERFNKGMAHDLLAPMLHHASQTQRVLYVVHKLLPDTNERGDAILIEDDGLIRCVAHVKHL